MKLNDQKEQAYIGTILLLVMVIGGLLAWKDYYQNKCETLRRLLHQRNDVIQLDWNKAKCEVCGETPAYCFKYLQTKTGHKTIAYYCENCYCCDRAHTDSAEVKRMHKIMRKFEKELKASAGTRYCDRRD